MRHTTKYKSIPAFCFESCLITADGPGDKGDRVASEGDWTKSKIRHRSHRDASQCAGRFTDCALSAGYEVIVRVIEDGTIKIIDHGDDDSD